MGKFQCFPAFSRWAADVEIHRNEWSFAELEHPRFHAEALELARDADILIIATVARDALPLPFSGWIDEWLETRSNLQTAVIFCTGSELNQRKPSDHWSDALTSSHGLSFFHTGLSLPPIAKQESARVPFTDPRACYNRWIPESGGIND